MKVGIYSLGCKVNIYESEYITELLKNHNYEIVPFTEPADIYIINTCSVTNESDRKSRKIIREAKRHNPNAIVIAMGCYTQIKAKTNKDEIEADIILGNKDKTMIVSIIEEYLKNNNQLIDIHNLREDIHFEDMTIHTFTNHTRAFVKIQDGCNAFCSYCIIPYARGQMRSKNFDKVLEEVRTLVNNGYKEIVLTGIHTGRYGQDINTNLETLLKELLTIPNLYRLRLSSIEINEVTDGIIKLLKDSSIMAKHLHIPLQSGSDKILKSMNRKYDLNFFLNRVKTIKEEIPDISLTTDLIVGFPGETDEDFLDTINTLNTIKFTKIHTFPYSKRDGTVASTMPNQIDGNIKKQRVRKILTMSHDFEHEFYQNHLNQVTEVLTETTKNNQTTGYTSNYIPITINKEIPDNTIITTKIIDITEDNQVVGEIVE
mgnify:CR=1 FL=1